MGRPDPAATVAGELRLLLRSYPEVSLADLAAALQPAAPAHSSPPAGIPSWESQVEPILRCAAAFGDSRQFASKRAALRILSAEFGVPSSWSNLHWNQLPAVVAHALLPHGPVKALELLHRHHLTAPAEVPPASRQAAPDSTVETTVGIIQAKHT